MTTYPNSRLTVYLTAHDVRGTTLQLERQAQENYPSGEVMNLMVSINTLSLISTADPSCEYTAAL